MDTSEECGNQWNKYALSFYGVKLEGKGWTSENQRVAIKAVQDVGNQLSKYTGKPSYEAFNKVHGGMRFEIGGCSQCNGSGAYTHSSHHIEIHDGAGFFKSTENRSSGLTFEMNVHLIVHKLGHAFANIGSWVDENVGLHLRKNSPYSSSFPSSSYLTNMGFTTGPDYTNPWMWRMHPDIGEDDITRAHEAFADMFLGFTYGEWADNDMGTDRESYMITNFAEWIPKE